MKSFVNAHLLAASLLFLTSTLAHSEPQKIVIGVSTPLTGDLAVAGTDTKNALEFANDYFFHGKYRFIIQDDGCSPAQGRSVAVKFTSVDKVKYLLGMFCNSELLNTASVYTTAGTLLITSGATSGDVVDVGPTIFRPYPADHFAAIELAKHVAARFQNVGIITELDEYTSLMERHFVSTLKGANSKVATVSTEVSGPASDFRSVLMKLKGQQIDALFLNTMSEGSFMIALTQAHQLGIKAQIIANLFPASEVVLTQAAKMLEGVQFSNVPLLDRALTSEGKEVFEKYKATYGPPQSIPLLALITMDSLRILDAALQSGEPPADYIRNVRFPGLAGEIRFDAHGAVSSIKYEMQEIRNGVAVRVEASKKASAL